MSAPPDANATAFAQLTAAPNAEARTAIVRALIDGGGRLALNGAADDFAHLVGVSLSGVRLRLAELAGADLREADLSGAFLAQCNLQGALLDGARLGEVDLSHADCSGAHMSEADLRSALLEEARLDGARLRFADLRDAVLEGAGLTEADLWGAQLGGADFSDATLRRARIGEAFAAGADFSRADLRDVVLTSTDLQGANFAAADLRGANLKGARLAHADFSSAQLQGVDLSACDLTQTRWSHARLDRTRLHRDQLGGVVGEEHAREFDLAARAYMALETNFRELGDGDAASWAYRRKRRMQKAQARRLAVEAVRRRRWGAAATETLRYLGDQFVEWICDYGDSVGRVFGALAAVYCVFLVLYGLTGSVARIDGAARTITRDPRDLAIFSLMVMTTSGTPSITLAPSHLYALLLTGTQALLGIFLTGLLGFVAGHRIRR